MEAYSEKVMDHFRSPRNVGEIENPDGVGKVGNPVCGDIMELYIRVKDGVIIDAKFKTFGCGAAEALGGLPPIKMHCSVLAEEALKKALDDYRQRSVKESSEKAA
jgi:nitrogen fixation NifU-like protein